MYWLQILWLQVLLLVMLAAWVGTVYAENRIVYCSRNFLATGVAPLITIMVTLPPVVGAISNTATVSSVTLDTNLADNVDIEVD